MARPKAKAPARRYHISGQSVVTIDGKDFYLGKHDSPESIARYAVLIGIYQQGGLKLPRDFDPAELATRADVLLGTLDAPAQQASQPILVRHITASYRELIKTKYTSKPAELHRLNQICDEADKHEGDRLEWRGLKGFLCSGARQEFRFSQQNGAAESLGDFRYGLSPRHSGQVGQ